MVKYDKIGSVLKGKKIKTLEEADFIIKLKIANELAEANRIKRLELGVELKARAYRGMFKIFKSLDGKSFTVPPTEKDKKNCQAEWDEIEKLMEDHA